MIENIIDLDSSWAQPKVDQEINLVRPKVDQGINWVQPQDFQWHEKLGIILYIATAALFIVAVALTIHYTRFPVGPLVHITGSFSMHLAVLVTSSIGATCGVILVAAHSKYTDALAGCVHIGNRIALRWGHNLKNYLTAANVSEQSSLNSEFKETPLHEGEDAIKGFWYSREGNAKSVILLHGNGMRANDMNSLGCKYKEKGFNVLLVEYRGCGVNRDTTQIDQDNLEKAALEDAMIAYTFVKEQVGENHQIIAHGFSLGGAYASMLAEKYEIPIILDHAFSTAAICMRNTAKVVTQRFAEKALKRFLPSPEGGSPWNSVKRITNKKILVIEGDGDWLMRGSAQLLLKAAYPNETIKWDKLRVVVSSLKHSFNPNVYDEDVMKKIMSFLENE